MSTQTQTGRVKWFNGKRGYGFITNLDNSEDVFVHHTGLVVNVDCWKNLFKGEYVEYVLTTAEDGTSHANSVTGIRGGMLMCEANHDESSRRRTRTSTDAPTGGDGGEGDSE